jgi:hypothetical protein
MAYGPAQPVPPEAESVSQRAFLRGHSCGLGSLPERSALRGAEFRPERPRAGPAAQRGPLRRRGVSQDHVRPPGQPAPADAAVWKPWQNPRPPHPCPPTDPLRHRGDHGRSTPSDICYRHSCCSESAGMGARNVPGTRPAGHQPRAPKRVRSRELWLSRRPKDRTPGWTFLRGEARKGCPERGMVSRKRTAEAGPAPRDGGTVSWRSRS